VRRTLENAIAERLPAAKLNNGKWRWYMTRKFMQMGLAGVLMGSLALGGGCATDRATWSMDTAQSVPAAEGKVKVANQKDGNTKVKVEVEHLAPPTSVADSGGAYVVWIAPENGSPQNVGVLDVGSNRKGKLETKTAFKEFTVKVTLEKSPAATTPRGATMMKTHITMPS
jgi:hypothetical protein